MTEYICDIGISYDTIVRRSHVREKVVRCKDCEMCKEYEIYDDKGNVERVEFRCTRPIIFLERRSVSMQEMLFGSNLNGMNVVLQNVKPNDFCSYAKRKEK